MIGYLITAFMFFFRRRRIVRGSGKMNIQPSTHSHVRRFFLGVGFPTEYAAEFFARLTIHCDGELTFKFQNGFEIRV